MGADNLLLRAAHGSDPDDGGPADELLLATRHGKVLGEFLYHRQYQHEYIIATK